MTTRLRWILLGIGLTCLLAAVIVFRQFIYVNVIMPISLILWAVLRVLMSIDQEFYWVALVFVAFIFGLSQIPVRARTIAHPAGRESRQPAKRLEYWQALIDRAGRSSEGQQTLRKNLQDLLINTMSVEDQADPNVVRDALTSGRLELPQEVSAYLTSTKSGRLYVNWTKPSWIGRLISRNKMATRFPSSEQKGMGAVLDFLESHAEIRNDNEYHSKY